MKLKIYSLLFVTSLLTVFTSCKKDSKELTVITDEDQTTSARAIYTDRSVNFNGHSDNATYTLSQATADFGNIESGWKEHLAAYSSNQFRMKLLKNSLGSGGMVALTQIANGSEYEVEYDLKFHSAFDFSKGGKIGWGLRIGDGGSGSTGGSGGQGGSFRVIWNGSTSPRLKVYAYHYDQVGAMGSIYGAYPASGGLQKGVWYTVKLYFKANTGSTLNGQAKMTVNGTTVVDRAMRWTSNPDKRRANKISFNTFRGGSTSDWESSTDGYIYFDNLSWNRISY